MKININKKIMFFINDGFKYPQAVARVVQEVILNKIYHSEFKDKITIKGGLVLFNLSSSNRRTTMDIYIDFIHHSIQDDKIIEMINLFNKVDDGITIELIFPIKELKQEDYKGKRITFSLIDSFGNKISNSKIDLGVNNKLFFNQEEYIFELKCLDKNVELLINSKEQIIIEKLFSLLKHGIRSTRFKDIYDIYYLLKEKEADIYYIYTILSNKYEELTRIKEILKDILLNEDFKEKASNTKYNWIQVDYEIIVKYILNFIEEMINIEKSKRIKV